MSNFQPGREVSKDVFDAMHANAMFSEGPYIESSDAAGYRDVTYLPNKRAYANLKGIGVVWAWVQGQHVKTAKHDAKGEKNV